MHSPGTLTPSLSHPMGEGARRAGEDQYAAYPTGRTVGRCKFLIAIPFLREGEPIFNNCGHRLVHY